MHADQAVVVITGGASGLGLAMAKRFAAGGYITIIIGRNKNKLHHAQAEIGSRVHPYTFDLTRFEEIPQLVKSILDQHQHIDVLINNAGIHLKKPLLETENAAFTEVVHTNLIAPFVLSREVAKQMINQKKGHILFISSMAAQYGIPQVIAYTAAKAGIEGMTRAMAVELSPLGIRVNAIAPGFIETDMSNGALDNDPQRKERVLTRTPMGKLGCPEDVAEAAFFLSSESARYITGEILRVDGGNAIGF
ncbi:MAG: SDR family oxidoreductase [Thermoflavifilum sp.]|nr:SDR family oxidoreductase [Thermoflavifilum sp.]